MMRRRREEKKKREKETKRRRRRKQFNLHVASRESLCVYGAARSNGKELRERRDIQRRKRYTRVCGWLLDALFLLPTSPDGKCRRGGTTERRREEKREKKAINTFCVTGLKRE